MLDQLLVQRIRHLTESPQRIAEYNGCIRNVYRGLLQRVVEGWHGPTVLRDKIAVLLTGHRGDAYPKRLSQHQSAHRSPGKLPVARRIDVVRFHVNDYEF